MTTVCVQADDVYPDVLSAYVGGEKYSQTFLKYLSKSWTYLPNRCEHIYQIDVWMDVPSFYNVAPCCWKGYHCVNRAYPTGAHCCLQGFTTYPDNK